MMAFDDDIQRVRTRILRVLFLRYALIALTFWAFAWGAASLVLRAGGWATPVQLLWGLAPIAVCLIAAARLAGRAIPPREQIIAAIDRSSAAGGLLMASDQSDVSPWLAGLAPLAPLRCQWRGRNWWVSLATGAALAATALLLPQDMLSVRSAHALDVDREVKRLTAQIETLEREKVLAEAEGQTLREQLNRLRADASGEDPVKTWESLDHVEQTLSNTAAEAAEQIAAQKQKLDTAKTLAKALAKATKAKTANGKTDPNDKSLAEAMKALSDLAGKAAAENQAVADQMNKSLGEACKDGRLSQEQLDELSEAMGDPGESGEGRQLSQEQLNELSEALGEAGDRLTETLRQLAEAGMIDGMPPEDMPPAGGEGQDVEGLIDFLEENEGDGSIAELVEAWQRQGPGRGGVTRGRGDAEMTWSDGTSADGAKFKPKVLPPAAVASLKKSLLAGVSAGSPGKGGPRTADAGGALSGATKGGGSAHAHAILPRHRRAVRRYFDRSGKEKTLRIEK